MSPLVWLFILLVSVLAAFFASLLTHVLASNLGALLILGIIAGVGWYLFGPRPHGKTGADHAPPE
jgi:NhaP-type Na+/H+ or K+/H+ antiporter